MTATIHAPKDRIVSVPPNLPTTITDRLAELAALTEQLAPVLDHLNDLYDPRCEEAARLADLTAAAAAARDGKPAATVGTPNQTKLDNDRQASQFEVDALLTARTTIGEELRAEFANLLGDPNASGVADAETKRKKYLALVQALPAARQAFYEAASRAAFIWLAAPAQLWPEGADGQPMPIPAWLTEAMDRLHSVSPGFDADGPQLHWRAITPPVKINTLSRNGTRDHDLQPVTAEHLIGQTFAAEVTTSTDTKDGQK
jgi:hypothetical protein